MSKKKEILSEQERFFLNLNEELSLDVEYKDFIFTMKVPELLMEATVSLGALRVAQQLLGLPEYKALLDSVKLPRLSANDEEDEDSEVTVKEVPIDLGKIQHVRYALNFFPDEFITTVNNIAYLNIAIDDISYKGKSVWIKVDGEDIHIDNFEKFVKYIRSKSVRYALLVDKLIGAFRDWLEAIEVTPQEVKN